jgi:hypothetical protein
MWPLNTPGITSAFNSGEPNFSTDRAIIAVVPDVTHGTCARRFSSSQIRRRTRLKPPSDSGFHSLAR